MIPDGHKSIHLAVSALKFKWESQLRRRTKFCQSLSHLSNPMFCENQYIHRGSSLAIRFTELNNVFNREDLDRIVHVKDFSHGIKVLRFGGFRLFTPKMLKFMGENDT